MPEQTEAKKDAATSVDHVKEQLQKTDSTQASTKMMDEIRAEQTKLGSNPNKDLANSAMKTYMENFAALAEKQGLIQPLSIDFMDTHKGLLGQDKSAIEDAAAKETNPIDKLMLKNIALKYDDLKNANKDDNKPGISQEDINQLKKTELETKKSEENRQTIAKSLNIAPDAYLKGGTTLYDVAKTKLEAMHSALPDSYGPPNQQAIFGEIAKMMERSDTNHKYGALKESDAKANLQKSIPKDWDLLTSKFQLKVYSEDELKQLQDRANNPKQVDPKQPTKSEKSDTVPNKETNNNQKDSSEKTETPPKSPEKTEVKSNVPLVKDKDLDLQQSLGNGRTRIVNLDNGDGAASVITYKENDKDVQVLTRKEDGTWTSKTGDQPEVPVSVSSQGGRLTVQESDKKQRIEYKNGTVLEMDGQKQTISSGGANPHVYKTDDGKNWTVDGKTGTESISVSEDGKLTRTPLNKDEYTLTSEEIARGREFFLQHFDEIDQSGGTKDGWVSDSDLYAYKAKHKAELSLQETKYLDYLNRHYSKIEDANNDETGFENDGITRSDINNWSQEKLFKDGHGDWLVMAPELSPAEQEQANAFITKNAKEMNKDGDTVVNPREVDAFLKKHANDQTVSADESALMRKYMASENEKLRQIVVKYWEDMDTNKDNGLSREEINGFAVTHPEQMDALRKLSAEVDSFDPDTENIRHSHDSSEIGLTVYDLVNETYRYTQPANTAS